MNQAQQEHLDNINEIIEEFDTVMMVSTDADNGTMYSRPMTIARYDVDAGILYFATSSTSGVVNDLESKPRINISMQSSNQYVSLSGATIVSNDREMIKALYSPAWKAWFPEGPEQEDIRLIKFDPIQGEYWDLSGFKGLEFLWEAGKAIAQDKPVNLDDANTHGKIDL